MSPLRRPGADLHNGWSSLAWLLLTQGKFLPAEHMYGWALQEYEKAYGLDHISTLETVKSWALRGKEKALGPEHISTLETANNLGNLYRDQGRMAEAEKCICGHYEDLKKHGFEHISTLQTVGTLGNLYQNQGKMAEAEEAVRLFLRAANVEDTSTALMRKEATAIY